MFALFAASETSIFYVVLILLAIFVFGLLIVGLRFYRKVHQGEAFVRTGVGGTRVSFGGMLSFEVKDAEAALKVLDNLELSCFAASLGGVRTTTQIPASMAFLDISEEERLQMNITDGMIRVSTGLEDADDLIADFDAALALI